MKIKLALIAMLLAASFTNSYGQGVCPPNIDFEFGNFTNWTCYIGSCCAVSTPTLTAPMPNRHDIMSGPGTDPYGGFPVVAPGGGLYSVRLGKDITGSLAERIRYYVHVPTGYVNYALVYRYALVLEDPGHSPSQQPRFDVTATDSITGAAIPCASYTYVSGPALPGFFLSSVGGDVQCRNWTTASLNLSGLGGTTVAIDFTAADCGLGGHFGYAYVDMSCGLFSVSGVNCSDTATVVTLSAPFGYQSYNWYDSATFTTSYGTGQVIGIPIPPGPITIAVILTPYVGYGCSDTLYAHISPSHLRLHPTHDTTTCTGVMITAGATDIALPLTYSWSPATGLSCTTCGSVLASPTVTTTYTVTVTNYVGCVKDTTIRVTVDQVTSTVTKMDDTCHNFNNGWAKDSVLTGLAPYTYSWSTTPVQTTQVATGLYGNGLPGYITYTVMVTDFLGCSDTQTVRIWDTVRSHLSVVNFVNPDSCNVNNGSITLDSLTPGITFTVSYLFNGTPQTQTLVANSLRQVTLTGLGKGVYSNIGIITPHCPFNTTGPVTLVDPHKPAPPSVVPPAVYCQGMWTNAISAGFDGTDPPELLRYYGPGVTPGATTPPIPNTVLAPDTLRYFITETTSKNCISDSAEEIVIVKVKPNPPATKDTKYCQFVTTVAPLNEQLDSAWNADSVSWYYNSVLQHPIPKPSTAVPGTTVWYASQWTNGCQSDSLPVRVTIVYQPQVNILTDKDWICQYDSMMFNYQGNQSYPLQYLWTIPANVSVVNGTSLSNPSVMLQFDSVGTDYYIQLYASDDNNFCHDSAVTKIRVVPQPSAIAYTKPDVCVGDTVELSLINRTMSAYSYVWYIDNSVMNLSPALNIVASNSNSGGPFSISWTDTGMHVITVVSTTIEGCTSFPALDSILVHNVPDATFTVVTPGVCLEDSALFRANTANYSYQYEWMPDHSFFNENKPEQWGRLESAKSIIALRVTDPFGCHAISSIEIDPDNCCKILFPNAFTPNRPMPDKVFAPIFQGYHRFHMFRIYNRWGQVIFESASTTDPYWDGTYGGVAQDMGVYFYYIKYDCGGKTLEQKGDVTLVR